MDKIKIKMEIKIEDQDIDDIVCTALEGGITYWADEAKVEGEYLGKYASDQISRGGELVIHTTEPFDDDDTEEYTLTRENFLHGLKLYLEDPEKPYSITCVKPHKWNEKPEVILDTCNVDGVVADMIIQYALFDEIIYG